MTALRTVGWIASIIYSTVPALWLVLHSWPRKIGIVKTPLFVAGPIWFLMWLIMGLASWPWRNALLYSTPWAWAAAAPLFASGFTLYVFGQRRFTADQLLGRNEFHPHLHEQRLVTSGIRRHVRHPIYLGHFCELLAWSIGTGLLVVYAMTVFAAITGVLMVRREDRELEERFGDEYRDYRRRVPGLIPRKRA
jgi:protein-S-isoprenylcysteine O-methyltransferase Ste14